MCSSAWAKGLQNVKDATGTEGISSTLALCGESNVTCEVTEFANLRTLNISVVRRRGTDWANWDFYEFLLTVRGDFVAPPGVWLPQHVGLGWKRLVCVQGDPLALQEVLLPARTRKAAGPGTHLNQPPNTERTHKEITDGTHALFGSNRMCRTQIKKVKEQHLIWSMSGTFMGYLNQEEQGYFLK